MHLDSESIRQTQRSLGYMPLSVCHNERSMSLYWIRLIRECSESLLTITSRHTVYEIEYAVCGSLIIDADGETICVREGEYLIIPPGMPHRIVEAESGGIKFIMGFNPGEGFSVPGRPIPATKAAYGMVQVLTDILENGGQELLCMVMKSILLAFIDSIPSTEERRPIATDQECVQRFIAFAESSKGVGISVREGARLVSLSERQLLRYCLNISGRTPSQIIQQARLDYIRTCLSQTRLNLSEIAELSGFQTEYAMAKFFRKFEGILPSAYRQMGCGRENKD